jgi:hypothetical protein
MDESHQRVVDSHREREPEERAGSEHARDGNEEGETVDGPWAPASFLGHEAAIPTRPVTMPVEP